MKFSEYFSSPVFDDEEGKRNLTGLLKIFLAIAVSVMPLLISLRLIEEFRFYTADFIVSGFFFLFILYYFLAKRNRILLSSFLFILTGWCGLTIMAFHSAGIRDVTITGYILLIFVATLFNGSRFGVLIAVISLASFWIMAVSEHFNILIPQKDPPLSYARDLSVIIILIAIAAILINRSFKHSYIRIRKELEERKKAQEDLFLNEKKLISKNTELINSYEKIKLMNEDLISAKEAAERNDKLKSAFLQNISHEIRTPMNGIVGFAELLRSDELSEEKKEEYSRLMTSCTYQLASVVNDLIDISKIETGDIELIQGEFKTDDLLGEDFSSLSRTASEKGINVEISNEASDIVIRSDQSKISQVLNNLMSNAVKFTNEGSIRVVFSKIRNNLCFSVADTGIGIEDELLPVIFDRFRQAETGLDRSYSGAGLGLTISKGLVDFLGGTIFVESETGKGSLFTVSIPVEFKKTTEGEKTLEPAGSLRNNLSILIADDDEISSIYLKEIFSDSVHKLYFARSGRDAVNIIQRNEKIDIILMDLKMPGMSGFEAAGIIKRSVPSVPIIAVSAFAPDDEFKKGTLKNIDEYIVKPVDRKSLFSRIEKVLSAEKRNINRRY